MRRADRPPHRRTVRRTACTIAVLALGGFSFVSGGGGDSRAEGATRARVRPEFVVVCAWDHRSYADPIVFPRMRGMAHAHEFFGNTTTDAFSTTRSLLFAERRGAERMSYPGTSCNRAGDRSAYWFPMLTKDGRAYKANVIRVYYRAGIDLVARIRPMPRGLRMIAGDHDARSAQPFDVSAWACSVDGDEVEVARVPTCRTDSPLRLRIIFPSCWNGRDLDSADHKSHMAYPIDDACPLSHPIAIPKIVISARYHGVSGSGVRLSCGSQYCGHADFMNAWDRTALANFVAVCLNGRRACGDMGGPGGAIEVDGAAVRRVTNPAPPDMHA